MHASVPSAPRARGAATLLLLTTVCLSGAAVHGQDQTVIDRRVPGPVDTVVVDNPRGDTEIRSWPGRDVRVVASRAGAGAPLASDLTIDRTAPASLRVAVRGGAGAARVDLRVFVPYATRVTLAADSAAPSRAGWSSSGAEADPSDAVAATRPRSVARARAEALETEMDDTPLELSARLVNLDVRVSDSAGRNLTMLGRQDFEVYEDGRRQELVHFEPISAPLNLVLLLDLSGSTKDKMAEIRGAAMTFIDSLPANNNIAVAAFTRKFLLVSPFTTDRRVLRERVGDLQNRDSGTAYYDSLWTALELFDEVEGGRRAVVVLTDGVDNTLSNPGEYFANHEFEEVLNYAVRTETTVFPIYFDTEYEVVVQRNLGSHEAYKTARREIDRLARQTGGAVFRADRIGELENAYRRVAGELQSTYSLAYESTNPKRDGSWRSIEVRVRRDDAKATTRPGYYAR